MSAIHEHKTNAPPSEPALRVKAVGFNKYVELLGEPLSEP